MLCLWFFASPYNLGIVWTMSWSYRIAPRLNHFTISEGRHHNTCPLKDISANSIIERHNGTLLLVFGEYLGNWVQFSSRIAVIKVRGPNWPPQLFRTFSKANHNALYFVHISTKLIYKTHDKCISLVLRTHWSDKLILSTKILMIWLRGADSAPLNTNRVKMVKHENSR